MKEDTIRERSVFNKYLELAREDSKEFFADRGSFIHFNCPACGRSNLKFEFEKYGFRYVSCKSCSTLFVNPRPAFARLNDFYTNSFSTRFWINEFFKPVAESRRSKIFRPRAEYINERFCGKKTGAIGDVGAGFGIFLEELRRFWPRARLIAIEPSPEQADICRNKGLTVECCALEGLKGFRERFDILTAFELVEHLFDPEDFFKHIRSLLRPGGYFLMTTLNSQGFDIQLLWEKSKSLHPPHHLNFFNPLSISLLLKRCGFEIVEVSTPGELDWDIVEGMIKNEGTELQRFWHLVAKNCSEKGKEELQNWISKNNLSSHMRIVAGI